MTTYTSRFKDPALPAQSIFHYLFPDEGQHSVYPVPPPDTPAFIDGLTGETVTRQDVKTQAERLAGGLHKLGMKRGDVAALFGTNSLEWLNAIFGAQCAGVVVSPVNFAYTPTELLHQLKHSNCTLVFIAPQLLPVLHQTLEIGRSNGYTLDASRVVLLCPPEAKPADGGKYKSVKELWGDRRPAERFERGQEHETAYLCYSSGTTGLAKGVETTHHNMTSQLQALTPSYQHLERGKDVALGFLPLSHMYGLALLVHHALVSGVPVVVLPRFEEKSVLHAIEKYKVTWALVVPPVLIILLQSVNLDRYDLSSWTAAMSAAAPLSESLCQALQKKLPKLVITQGYGLTETTPIITCMRTEECLGRQGSIGRLLPTFEARLVDPEMGKDVGKGEAGELWVRSPSVMKGYLNNPAATRGTFAGEGKGRWFKTGDMAVVDDQGYFSIVDRLKELIKYKGYQVAPAELEATLLTCPLVADCAVVGVYAEELATELPRAYVVPKGGLDSIKSKAERDKLSADVVEWMKGRVANQKQLRGGCVLMDVIPKSPTGKILRKNLRAMIAKELEEKAKAGKQAYGQPRAKL